MVADPRTLNVTCPHCAARYLLPAQLLGPGGARVRCPGCGRSFDVAPPAIAEPAEAEVLTHAALGAGDFALAGAEADIESEVRHGAADGDFAGTEREEIATRAAETAESGSAAAEVGRSNSWAMPPAGAAAEFASAEAESESEALAPAASPPASAQAPEAVAREVLEAVARRAGADLAAAAAAGHLFAHYGPQIFAAFDEYRKRAGDAGSAPFRAALRGLWGIDLPEVIRRR